MSTSEARQPKRNGLSPAQAARVYDRIGKLQDTQAPIERAAVDRLVDASDLRHATAVFELGCGTGRFAQRILRDVLPEGAQYVGGDVSSRMVTLASRAISPWSARAKIVQLDGTLPLPLEDGSADRFVACFVLDLLESEYARQLLDEANRILTAGGLLCVSSLTWGHSHLSRRVSTAWHRLWMHTPRLVGGCRPIEVRTLLNETRWRVVEDSTIESWGVPSEVLVAARA